ncbi:glycosyl transferase [Candidatus Aminicenantes bacterium AH-873-B07]|jgi:glucosyl-3-phosphoglycerate synthase|nr:glycosyl transferase [Candidatus Aminicenantes bacterium AH-873-B07]
MGDFFQNGVITTFHKLGKLNLRKLESELKKFSKMRKIALILPALYREFEGDALPKIIDELRKIKYLGQIVLCLDKADESQFKKAKKLLSPCRKIEIIWNDGPRIKKLYQILEENELSPGSEGKGRAVWISMGYILAIRECEVIALQDCDILNYDRTMLARLCYPVANPSFDYEFCKGYYSRVTDRMHGRVTRLFYTPFIRALQKMLGYLPFLVYMDSFRYALSGEFSMRTDLAMVSRIPGDWGLEVGTLAEVYKNVALHRICQVDIADSYEHKHQELDPENPEKGLLKMVIDISRSIFRTLASEGVQFSEGFFKSLSTTYMKIAKDTITQYENDAAINGLYFDRHQETVAVESFTKGIKIAGEQFWENPFETSLIPSWSRVISAIPNFFDLIKEAVKKDNF